jgi:hypothetical protein
MRVGGEALTTGAGGLFGASSVILTAPVLAYGLGYAYYKSYFGLFGVDVLNLPIPIDHYFAQGVLSFFIALAGSADTGVLRWLPLVCSLILIAALIFPQFARIRTIVAWVVVLPLLTSGVASAFQQGREDAGTLIDDRPAYVDLHALGEVAPADPNMCEQDAALTAQWSDRRMDLVRANECGRLRSIWQDEQASLLGAQTCGADGACRWQVYRLSTEDFAVIATESQSVRRGTSGEAP